MKLTETREQNGKVEKEGAGKCGGMWGIGHVTGALYSTCHKSLKQACVQVCQEPRPVIKTIRSVVFARIRESLQSSTKIVTISSSPNQTICSPVVLIAREDEGRHCSWAPTPSLWPRLLKGKQYGNKKLRI